MERFIQGVIVWSLRSGLVMAFLLVAATQARAEGGAAQAAASIRIVGSGMRMSTAPLSLAASSDATAYGVGSFTIANPGSASPWFLTVRAPEGASVVVRDGTGETTVGATDERKVAWAASGEGAGQFVVQPSMEVRLDQPADTALTASVTSGP